MTTNDRLQQLLGMLETEPDDAFCLYGIAQEYAVRGDHERAESFFTRAIEADPDHAYAHFHLARSLMALDRTQDAVTTLKNGLQAADRSGDGHATAELQDFLDEILDPNA